MPGCDRISKMIARLDAGLSVEDERELRSHLDESPECLAELTRLQHLANTLSVLSFEDATGDEEHLTDVELAAAATHGVSGPGHARLAEHLARCSRCREELVAVRRLLDQQVNVEEDTPPDNPGSGGLLAAISRALSMPVSGTRALLGTLMAFLEWTAMTIGMFLVVAACILDPEALAGGPLPRLLGIAPRDDLRLWLIVCVCGALAVIFRWLGAECFVATSATTD